MKIYTTKKDITSANAFVADDMILTKDMPTAAGSKMLDGYMSLFDAEILGRLQDAGYSLVGKTDVGEFAIDLVGETSYNGACVDGDKILCASSEAVKSGDVAFAVCMDVNGSVRRAAAQNDLVAVKPTYGTVSRYGTIPVACSGETVSIMSSDCEICRDVLSVVAGHDDKDGTSLSEDLCAKVKKDAQTKKVAKVAVIKDMKANIDADTLAKFDDTCAILAQNGIEAVEVDSAVIAASRVAWNILMSAELCNNVSRYDGVKYGYRAENFTNIDELYTNSRSESFGKLLKTAILFGSETLSTENYMKVYDKALRTRRVIKEEFDRIFADYDAVIMPVCSKMEYRLSDVKTDEYIAYKENFYTAPASLTGLPAVTVNGVQFVGNVFSENALLDVAAMCKKEGK